ncbi:MAG: DUF2232 domain-containing protein, partial [Proteobacteria bacterium]|nr:DUF2232 domain-containing protein [Pseudomonadota bacterium]
MYLAAIVWSLGALLLAILTPLPLFLVGLSMGARAAGIAGAMAALIVIAASSTLGGVMYIGAYALPVFLVCRSAMLSRSTIDASGGKTVQWYPPGMLSIWLTLVPVAVFVLTFFYTMANGDSLEALMTRLLEPFILHYRAAYGAAITGTDAATPGQLEVIEKLIIQVAPAMIAIGSMATVLLNGVLAQGVLSRFSHNMRPSPRMAEIELPHWLIVCFAASFLLGITIGDSLGYLALALAGTFAFPLFLSGLGVAHAAADRSKVPFGLLFVIYALLSISRWGTPAAVILGLIDHFAFHLFALRGGASTT